MLSASQEIQNVIRRSNSQNSLPGKDDISPIWERLVLPKELKLLRGPILHEKPNVLKLNTSASCSWLLFWLSTSYQVKLLAKKETIDCVACQFKLCMRMPTIDDVRCVHCFLLEKNHCFNSQQFFFVPASSYCHDQTPLLMLLLLLWLLLLLLLLLLFF